MVGQDDLAKGCQSAPPSSAKHSGQLAVGGLYRLMRANCLQERPATEGDCYEKCSARCQQVNSSNHHEKSAQ